MKLKKHKVTFVIAIHEALASQLDWNDQDVPTSDRTSAKEIESSFKPLVFICVFLLFVVFVSN